MSIATHGRFTGPNPYGQCSVVRFDLEGFDAWPTDEAERVVRNLFVQYMRDGVPNCAAAAEAALSLGHLFEHLCIGLQNRAGADLACQRHNTLRSLPANAAAVPYVEERVCLEAARWADEMLSLGHAGGSTDLATERLEGFMRVATRWMLPVQDREVVRTAIARDIPAMRLVGRVIVLGQGCKQQRLSATKTSKTSVVGNDLAANKDYARRLLAELGLPAPRYERVHGVRASVEAAKRIGFPVVVKPNNGSMGAGVCIRLRNPREVRAAYRTARESSRSVLVEELVEGFDYRMLVIDGKLCAAAQRVPAHVTGDGRSTVEELVEVVNADPRRGAGSNSSWTRIEIDDRAESLLNDVGMTRSSVPTDGQQVYLRRNANTSDGGTAVDVTDGVHPDNVEIAERAAKGIGLDIAGVDFLTEDISKSMWETGGKICEVNSRPGIRKHLWPAVGRRRDVTSPIIEMLFPGGDCGRIPIVTVVGNGDVDRTATLLAQILRAGGIRAGLTTVGDAPAPVSARRLLLDPGVEVAVLALDGGDVSRHGLGLDACNLTLVVNSPGRMQDDALQETMQLAARCARDAVLIASGDVGIASLEGVDRIPELVKLSPGTDGESIPVPADNAASLAAAAATRLGVDATTIARELSGAQGATTRRSSSL